jgi:hypothetical protein
MKYIRMIVAFLVLTAFIAAIAHAAPTTEVRIVKFGTDGVTILNETVVDYRWMEAYLPVQGDGITHYYHQGPVFADGPEARWDKNETTNFKDHGALKGTDIRDLCELTGGMDPGDEVMVHAVDGYHVEFAYANVYEPQPRQGPIVLCWYNGEDATGGERQGSGYPPDFYNGMRIVFFADTSTNAEGKHVFGNWDMHECMPDSSQHFYELYPSTNGFTPKWVNEIRIYSGGYGGVQDAPVKSLNEGNAKETPVPLIVPLFAVIAIFGIVGISQRKW